VQLESAAGRNDPTGFVDVILAFEKTWEALRLELEGVSQEAKLVGDELTAKRIHRFAQGLEGLGSRIRQTLVGP
jgi:hypothetical protein